MKNEVWGEFYKRISDRICRRNSDRIFKKISIFPPLNSWLKNIFLKFFIFRRNILSKFRRNSIGNQIRPEFRRIFPSEYSKKNYFPSTQVGVKKIPSENFFIFRRNPSDSIRIPAENRSVGKSAEISANFSEYVEFLRRTYFFVEISQIFSRPNSDLNQLMDLLTLFHSNCCIRTWLLI